MGKIQLRLELPEVAKPVVEVDELVDRLSNAVIGSTVNFYDDAVPGAAARRDRLRRYLTARWDAPILLVGEAPGYQGQRQSGIPFTSEAQLGVGNWKEPSATIVHTALRDLEAEERVMLWNACPLHPCRPGEPLTNRTPTSDEIEAGRPFLKALAYGRRVVAVGQVAGRLTGAPVIRHPANGGATLFREGLARQLDLILGA